MNGANSPTLTVVLPNRNHAQFLPRAIAALLAQDRPAEEILIIDDASTDNSREVIDDYARRAPSVRALENRENLGVIATLRRGLENARGRYVYLAAADDFVWPGFFSRAVRLLDSCPQAGLFCAEAALTDGETGRLLGCRPIARPRFREGYVSPTAARRLLGSIDHWVLTGSAVFRTISVREAGGLNARLGSMADSYLARKIAIKHGFCFAPVIVSSWSVSPRGVSRTSSLRHAQYLLAAVPPLLSADPDIPAWYAEIFRRRWRFATARLALEQNPPDRALLVTMGLRSGQTANIILGTLPRALARPAILLLLWIGLRPTSLLRVAATALVRRLDGTFRRAVRSCREPTNVGARL